MNKYFIWAIGIILLLVVSGYIWTHYSNVKDNSNANIINNTANVTRPPSVFCAQDVKQCPNGSFVGRDSLNDCKFKPCF